MEMNVKTNGMHVPSARTTMLLGTGLAAVAGLGAYLYKKPRLRRQMRKADTVKDAAMLLGSEIRHDSADMAHDVVSSVTGSAADGLKTVQSKLGLRRFIGRNRTSRVAKDEATA